LTREVYSADKRKIVVVMKERGPEWPHQKWSLNRSLPLEWKATNGKWPTNFI